MFRLFDIWPVILLRNDVIVDSMINATRRKDILSLHLPDCATIYLKCYLKFLEWLDGMKNMEYWDCVRKEFKVCIHDIHICFYGMLPFLHDGYSLNPMATVMTNSVIICLSR